MQVNKDKFPAVLPHFLELLSTCEFYSFDEEMTGINVPEVTENITFSPEESYHSKRLAASRYSMIQLGVCLFHKVGGDGTQTGKSGPAHYVARPFNFILFPNWTDELAQLRPMAATGGGTSEAGADKGVNKDVVLSPSALAFLRRHGMDFQQWVYEGVSLCDSAGERLLRQHLAEKHQSDKATLESAAASAELFTDEERAWAVDSIAAAEALALRLAEAEAADAASATPSLASAVLAVPRDVMLKPQTSRSAREHLRQHLQIHLPSLNVSFRRAGGGGGGGGGGALTSTTLTALTAVETARKQEKDAALRAREELDLLGVRLVFSALVASKKPCVGHNCLADLLFLMAALDQPLPESLPAWKARATELFPTVLDTKYLVSRRDLFPLGRFPASYLGGLFDQYGFRSPRVHVTLPVGFEAYAPLTLLRRGGKQTGGGGGVGGSPAHEAAFDALMTGTLLLNLLAEVGRDVHTAGSLGNKVALFRSLYTLDLGNREGDEYVPAGQEHETCGGALVLELRHDVRFKAAQLEGCLTASDLPNATLYSVADGHTLAVVPRTASTAGLHAAAAAARVGERFAKLSVAPYVPPHLSGAAHVTGAKFKFPSAASSSGSAAVKSTLRSVLR